MIFNNFLASLKKHWLMVVIWVVVVAGIALFATWQLPQSYEAGSTATAVRGSTIDQSDVDYYLYDNYYSIQSGAFIADNIVSWLASPPIVAEIYNDATVTLPEKNLKALSSLFTSKKQSSTSNVVSYTISDSDPDAAENLIQSANKYIAQLVKEINSSQKDDAAYFSINFSEPVVVKVPKAYTINGIVGGLIGLLVALGILIYNPNVRESK